MSKIKNISRTGWLVAGIIAALLLVPTTAVAVSTATMTIIKGGSASGEASVTAAHQLLSTTVNPKAYVNTGPSEITQCERLCDHRVTAVWGRADRDHDPHRHVRRPGARD